MRKKAAEDLKKWCKILVSDQPAEEAPEGWSTILQISEEINRPRTTTERQLKARLKDGTCEMKKFRVRTGSIVRPVPHYRIK